MGASFLRAASRHALIDEDEMQLTAGIAKPSDCARRARQAQQAGLRCANRASAAVALDAGVADEQ